MAEELHYDPAAAHQDAAQPGVDIERLQARLAEVDGLIDALYAGGLIRWLRALVVALPEVSTLGLESLNTPEGHAGLNNLFLLARQLGRIDPMQMECALNALHTGFSHTAETAANTHATANQAPGLGGVIKLMRDEALWRGLAPLLEGIRAASAKPK